MTTKIDPQYHIHNGDALGVYDRWAKISAPVTIFSDGAYGVGGFDGDPKTPAKLAEWYEPHIKAWSEHATAQTALWFWNTEIGWAIVHPMLVSHGWKYVQLAIWDKGIGHIAGNVNSNTIRRLPTVTEVVGLYCREPVFESKDSTLSGMSMQEWLRAEWKRSGLPFSDANKACGIKNAASRKYLASDHLWYQPPAEHMLAMSRYANENGREIGADENPYFHVDGLDVSNESAWNQLRYKWNHLHGLTNVFTRSSLRSTERLKVNGKNVHTNQKPLDLCEYLVNATTDPGDAVWEPFGGLGSASVAAAQSGRIPFYAELSPDFAKATRDRLESSRI